MHWCAHVRGEKLEQWLHIGIVLRLYKIDTLFYLHNDVIGAKLLLWNQTKEQNKLNSISESRGFVVSVWSESQHSSTNQQRTLVMIWKTSSDSENRQQCALGTVISHLVGKKTHRKYWSDG